MIPVGFPESKYLCSHAAQQCNSTVSKVVHYNYKMIQSHLSDDTFQELVDNTMERINHPKHILLHVAGDFYSKEYFDAWMEAARRHDGKTFEFVTKNLAWLLESELPKNVKAVASAGGLQDELLPKIRERNQGIAINHVRFSDADASLNSFPTRIEIFPEETPPEGAIILQGLQEANTESGDFVTRYGSGQTFLKPSLQWMHEAVP